MVVPFLTSTSSTFLTGAVHLLSKVNLVIAKGATLRFSAKPADYPLMLTSWEANDCYNHAPLIHAFRQTDIAISGEGTLDGRASDTRWWPWFGDPAFGWRAGMPRQGGDRAT